MINRLLAIAPMMDCTDRHFRYLARLLSPHILLYTEMITAQAILHCDNSKLLAYHPGEHPVAIQLGGSDPTELAQAAKIAADYGYDEINLNVGCPSDRVQAGRFGACLMKEPELVAACIAAMKNAVQVPVTVKIRLGVDDYDSYEYLHHFVTTVAAAGCETFIVHARKAWLKGLSPKENREIPPLDYERVYRLKRDFPYLQIILNGGVKNFSQITAHLIQVDGVMLGRAAYSNPYLLAEVDRTFFGGCKPPISRPALLEQYFCYMEQQLAQSVPWSLLARPLLGLFQGLHGAKNWRRHLTQPRHRSTASIVMLRTMVRNVFFSYL